MAWSDGRKGPQGPRRDQMKGFDDDDLDGGADVPQQIVPELQRGEYIRHCADCRHAKVRASLESKSGIEIFCAQGKWRDKSSHRKTFKRMSVVLDAGSGYFKETADLCEAFESMAGKA